MKYCPYCGKENEENNKFCVGCGKSLDTQDGDVVEVVEAKTMNEQPKKSTLDLVGMILGIISVASLIVCCCGAFGFISILTGIAALIVSIISIVRNGSNGKAIAGLVLGIIGIILSVVVFAALPTVIQEFQKQIVDGCNNGTLDSDVCEEYKEIFPDWFE